MKKFFMIACMMLMSTAMFAQDSKMAVGANVNYGAFSGSYNPFGFGAKFQYEFVENFRAEAAGNYWTKKSGLGFWDVDLNFHYLIPVADAMKIYPLAGASLIGTTGLDKNETMFGFNVGAGFEYYVAENIKLNADIYYKYGKKTKSYSYTEEGITIHGEDEYKLDGIVFSIGAAYCF